jgi:hypothetical protein
MILRGEKTQTRRVVKAGETLSYDENTIWQNVRIKWQVGSTYALQPGRGKSAVGRIRLTSIEYALLQDMGTSEAIAEGYSSIAEYARVWDSINTRKGTRWADNPAVWVFTFEVVEGQHE